jgi:glycine oxidase
MKSIDYIIIGCGLASIAFCETLKAHKKTFMVFDDSSQRSSIVAAGLYNPVILKRFSEVWKAKEQLALALPMYAKIEEDLKITVDYKLSILRRFTSIEEQNKWFTASDKPSLESFLSTQLIKNTNPSINAELGFGEVLHAGRIDTETLVSEYKSDLKEKGLLEEKHFQYDLLQTESEELSYTIYKTKHIIFAEGFGVKKNPFFRHVPLEETKGELLMIKAPDLKIDFAIKSSVFVIPLGNDLYRIGATYERENITNTPTQKAKEELLDKLKRFINCDFEVVEHYAGIRPTVKDRRPLIGRHIEHKNLYILNGLGSRGVMIAPYVAEKLFKFVENNIAIDKEIDVNRF